MSVTSIGQAWNLGRAERDQAERARRPAPPVALRLAHALGRLVPRWRRVRTAAMQVTAFGFADWALFELHFVAGLAGVAVSLFALEALGKPS